MSTEYDSGKIRSLAKRISDTAAAVGNVGDGALRGVTREMPGNFTGAAADALQESVNDLMTDVSSISSRLTSLSRALYELAARVDYADQQAKLAIQDK